MENKKLALITGASSGIGRDIALQLASKNYNIIAVARSKDKLEDLKKRIEDHGEVKVDIYILDIVNREGVYKLYEYVKEKYGNIDILINNAGFGKCGNFVDIELEEEIKMVGTNITALHMLTKLFLKDMVKKDYGYILNVASIAGFFPGPLMATYYATKSYVITLTESIRYELKKKKSKVVISALCPGPVDTNFNKVANVKFSLKSQNSKKVAEIAIKKLFKNKALIFTNKFVYMARVCSKILPDNLMAKFCYNSQKRKIYKK